MVNLSPSANSCLRIPRLTTNQILHIMTATLSHAQPVLSAASASGFRESGLQSLRCLEGDDGPSPIVAVRSSGLSLESVIGYCDDDESDEPLIYSLVTEEYLEMLIAMSNERFGVNAERRERFRSSLLESCSSVQSLPGKGKARGKEDWEDPVVRRERKKAEGLMRKKLLESQKAADSSGQDFDDMNDAGGDIEVARSMAG